MRRGHTPYVARAWKRGTVPERGVPAVRASAPWIRQRWLAAVVLLVCLATISRAGSAAREQTRRIAAESSVATRWPANRTKRALRRSSVDAEWSTKPPCESALVFDVGLGSDPGLRAVLDSADPARGVWVARGGDDGLHTVAWQLDEAGESVAWLPAEFVSNAASVCNWQLSLGSRESDGGPVVFLRRRSVRTGAVVVDGLQREFVLVDGDLDGHFDGPGDSVTLDVDGDGRLRTDVASHEVFGIGAAARIGDRAYRVTVENGTTLELVRGDDSETAPMRSRWPIRRTRAPGEPWPNESAAVPDLVALLADARSPSMLTFRIGCVGTPEAFAALRRLVEQSDRRQHQIYAVRAMGNPRFLQSSAYLQGILGAGDELSAAAVVALVERGGDGLEHRLAGWAADATHPLRAVAAYGLGELGTVTARRIACQLVSDGSLSQVRKEAYMGLRTLPDPPPLEVMRAAVESGMPGLVWAAVEDLFASDAPGWRDAATTALESTDALWVASSAVDVLLSDADVATIDVLMGYVRQDKRTELPGRKLANRLHRVRSQAVIERLTVALDDDSALVRRFASDVLGGVPSSLGADALAARFRVEEDGEVQAALREALIARADSGTIGAGFEMWLRLQATQTDWHDRAEAVEMYARVLPDDRWLYRQLKRLMVSSDPRARITAIDGIAAGGLTAFHDAVVSSLDHAHRATRVAAAECLAVISRRPQAAALIDALAVEAHPQVRRALIAALDGVVGSECGDDVEAWRRALGQDAIPGASKARQGDRPSRYASTEASFYGVSLWTDRVMFVLDASGSMLATVPGNGPPEEPSRKIDLAARELTRCVDALGSGARVNASAFAATGRKCWDAVRRIDPRASRKLTAFLTTGLPSAESTNIAAGLTYAFDDPGVEEVVLLTDGGVNSGEQDSGAKLLRWIARRNRFTRLPIHCVSIGKRSGLLLRIARMTGGQHSTR